MNQEYTSIPAEINHVLKCSDRAPLSEDAWIKFQSVSLLPGIAKNYRYLLMQDGRLYYAANEQKPPEDHEQVYNVDLPEEPNRILSENEIDSLCQMLQEVDFFNQRVYQQTKTRDGSLSIVTVRRGDQVHEVWYANVDNALTEALQSISPSLPKERTPEQELSALMALLKEQQELSESLKDETQEKNDD